MKSDRKISKIDDIFELDRFQLVVLLFNEFLIFTMVSNVVFNIFGTAPPTILGCDDLFYNGTKAEVCEQFREHSSCREVQLQYEFFSTTVEFGQLCNVHEPTWLDKIIGPLGISNKPKLSTTSQMIGIIVGSAISGQLSDLYGRKKVTLGTLIFMLIFSTLSSFSPSMDIYIIFRFFIGIACGGLTTVGCVFIVELLPAAHRLWLSTVITWAPNYMLLALIAKVTGSWRILSRANNVITLGAVLICAFLTPESPKFLVQKRRKDAAVRAISYINKWKNVENRMTEEQIEEIAETACEEACRGQAKAKKYSFIHLYSTKTLAVRTLVCSMMMFSLSYVTYGLIFNLDVIKGSVYLNTAFSGVLRWVVGATVAVVDHFGRKQVGRKRLHFATMSSVMVCMAGTFLLYCLDLDEDYAGLLRALTLLAFGTTGCIFLQYSLITSELFPTAIRNLASAHINVCGRVGNVLGPLVFNMAIPLDGFPYLFMTILCFLDVILFHCFIPETKGQPLPSEMPVRKRKDEVQMEEQLVKA